MLSIITYGRNDSYGYRLEKRAALSLNSWGEMLDPDRGDEIVFCDYNTPDELPTFPEAVADTLTSRARELLRVVRVRPQHHARWAERTHLVALESIARNAALRRTDPGNRWVLSTNTDMIFLVPGGLIAPHLETLDDGFYQLPRFELPEAMWSEWDRHDPARYHADIARLAGPLGLDRVVLSRGVVVDAPGDFQLGLRRDLFDVAGFDEEMLHGWHVDSNMVKRAALHRGEGARVLPLPARGYHCDHTLAPTATHAGPPVENDWKTYYHDVELADLSAQQPDWGLAHDHLEEFRLSTRAMRVTEMGERASDLASRLPQPLLAHDVVGDYDFGTYTDVPVQTLLSHATSLFASFEPGAAIAWSGSRVDVLLPLREVLTGDGRTGRWLIDDECDLLLVCPELAAEPDVDIVDFTTLAKFGPDVVVVEAALPASSPPAEHPVRQDRRAQAQRVLQQVALDVQSCDEPGWDPLVVGIGVAGTTLQPVHSTLYAAALAPSGTGLRLGRVRREPRSGRTLKDLAIRVARAAGPGVRLTPSQFSEIVHLTREFAGGATPPLPAGAVPIVRALALDEDAPNHLGLAPWSLEAVAARLPPPADGSVPAASGAVRLPVEADLEDEGWRTTALASLGAVPTHLETQGGLWVLATLVHELRARAGRRPSVVIISDGGELLLPVFAPFCDHVTVLGSDLRPHTPDTVPGGAVDSRRLVADPGSRQWDVCIADLAELPDLGVLQSAARALGARLVLGYQAGPALVLPLDLVDGGLRPLHQPSTTAGPNPGSLLRVL